MKIHNFTSLKKTTLVFLLFAMFGFYQTASAQLTVVNNLQCWILVGEEEGNNCQFCNNPAGTWVAPIQNAPFNTVTFNPTCGVVSPFPPFNHAWIGVKYCVGGASPGPCGPGSFTENPFYGWAPCGYNQNNEFCAFNPVNPVWTNGGGGAMTVTFQ